MPVCCNRAAAEPPSMKMMALSTAAAGRQPRRQASPTMPRPPMKRWPRMTRSNVCIEAFGASHAKASSVGVKISDCGSAIAGWPPK